MKYFTAFCFLLILSSCDNDDIIADTSILQLSDAITVYETSAVPNDLILVTPIRSDTTYLINRQGMAVKKWYMDDSPVLMAYLLDNGSVVRAVITDVDNGITIPGKTGKIQIINKDNILVWEWVLDNASEALHHDIAVLPNGNILASVWETHDASSSIAKGRNPQTLLENRLVVDKIIEIEPVGFNQANIIWEWDLWDHLTQDFNPSASNFGNVANQPHLMDINVGAGENFSHVNGLDYIVELDQIIVNSRELSEFIIIDHSTTTFQAANSSGGRYGKGGDFLFRWGNPRNFKTGTINDQQLFGQHDATYVGNNSNSIGTFLVFNNLQDGVDFSTIKEIDVNIDATGRYPNIIGIGNAPSVAVWEYSNEAILSKRTSGCQRLPSGNTLITSTSGLILREINTSGKIIWEYNFENEAPSQLMMNTNSFKSRSYPRNNAGIQALNLQ